MVMVMVSVDTPLSAFVRIDVGLNDLVATGEPITVRFAVLLGKPVGALEVTPEVVFGNTPVVELVTVTVTVQLLFAASEPPVSVMAFAPVAPAVAETAPPQALVTAGVPATCMLLSVSVKPTALNATAVGLFKVNVMTEVLPVTILAGANALAMLGVPTARVALAVPPVPELVDVTLPVVFR